MSIFEEQLSRKPNHYPWTEQFIESMHNGFWTDKEFSFTSDVQQFKTSLTDQEREIIVRVLSAIGQIEVAVPEGIPGVDGNLKLEVVLSESDDYGTVIAQLIAPIGTVIVDESTFDQRTMWSPRGKTPIFLLTLTYSFIFIVWGIFIYLFINLVRIIKS